MASIVTMQRTHIVISQGAGFLHDAGMVCRPGCMCARYMYCCLRLCVCFCFASGFCPVSLPQARSRVPVRCICCAGMPGFCMMLGYFAGQVARVLGTATLRVPSQCISACSARASPLARVHACCICWAGVLLCS